MLMYSLCLLCSFSELLLTVISCNACALCHWVSIKATYLLTYLLIHVTYVDGCRLRTLGVGDR